MIEEIYHKQAELLLDVLPHFFLGPHFALKGGTAINLFVRDMPRLSVDIDLTYMPLENRESTLSSISDALSTIASKIEGTFANIKADCQWRGGKVVKLTIDRSDIKIKVEPNLIFRGSVFPTLDQDISKEAEKLFGMFITARTLSIADLYGSKICAALDRQHPRDFFDVHILLRNEGLTDDIRKAFVVYLAGYNRPMNELLNPNLKDIREIYQNEFYGITRIDVTCEELEQTRDLLISKICKEMTTNEREFLLSIKKGEPAWNLMDIEGIDALPALRWKLLNIRKMSKKKNSEMVERLKSVLKI